MTIWRSLVVRVCSLARMSLSTLGGRFAGARATRRLCVPISFVLAASLLTSLAPSASAAKVWLGADKDQDGIRDDVDQCLDNLNPDSLDYDRDGSLDACDLSTVWTNPDGPGGEMRFIVYLRDQYGDAIHLPQCSHSDFTWIPTNELQDPVHMVSDDCYGLGYLITAGRHFASGIGTISLTMGPGDCDGVDKAMQVSGGPGRYTYDLNLICPDIDNDGLSSAGEYISGDRSNRDRFGQRWSHRRSRGPCRRVRSSALLHRPHQCGHGS